jgi:hypothetical protein
MKPRLRRATEGRANPQGIPYLYTATVDETAAAEVRPWLGAYVSVAQLRTNRQLKVVNLTTADTRLPLCFHEPAPEKRDAYVWRDIDRAFARPVERDDDSAEYTPTQVIAEAFKAARYDGVGYRSSLGSGHNVALFDIDAADIINCTVHKVERISFDLPEVANRYFVTKFYQDSTGTDV